jgi:dipeptidyl aminopeptidase/acylaminoacyl peptidase
MISPLKITIKVVCLCLVAFISICYAENDKENLEFFSMPDMTMAKISPNGQFIATIRFQKDKQKVTLINTDTLAESLLLNLDGFFKEKATISQIIWIDDQHIAAQLVEVKKGIEDLLNTKKSQRLLVIKIPSLNKKAKVYSVRTKGWLVHPMQEEAGTFLYAKSSIYSKVYKINVNKLAVVGKKLNKLSKIDGGQFKRSNEVSDIYGYATRWFIDTKGKPQAVLHFNEKQNLTLSTFDNNKDVKILKSWPKKDEEDKGSDENTLVKNLIPIEMADQLNSFYCLDSNEEETRTIYLVNYDTGNEEVVYEADSFKIVDLVLSPDTHKLISVKVIRNSVIENVFINDEQLQTAQQSSKSSILMSRVSESLTGDKTIVYMESHNNPGQFMLQSNQQSEKQIIGERFPSLSNKLSSKLIESRVKVKGLEIPYLLSIPKNEVTKHPLIVMPHGGPVGVYDNRYYNPIVQYLVANDFAVLQVNFRGSSGYSAELKSAGKSQWGKLMLEDIYQATLSVLAHPEIDEQRVCSFGMSYGGYAALMLTLKHPELYKCAANWAGVTDVNLYLQNPRLIKAQHKWIKEHVGISEMRSQELKDISPVYLANSLTTPVFIAHGKKDEIVDIEHAFRMKLMLDKFGKNYQWYVDDEGTHSFGKPVQQQNYFSQLTSFINKNIH